jgi:hypothetical protein
VLDRGFECGPGYDSMAIEMQHCKQIQCSVIQEQ